MFSLHMDRSPVLRNAPHQGRARAVPSSLGALSFRIPAVALILAAITWLFYRVIPVNATTAGFVYLIAVLIFATVWGFPEALAASVLSVLCFNFFYFEPVGTFNIAEPQNWVALFAFLVTAVVASELSFRAKQRAQLAVDRQHEMERLYALSRAILLTNPDRSAGKQIALRIAEIFQLETVVLYDSLTGETHRAGAQNSPQAEAGGRQSPEPRSTPREVEGRVMPIELGGRPVGSLAVHPDTISETAHQAICNLVAIGLERVRGQEAASRAEAARQSQELKSTLLDAIAHEFKTPLTCIKASSTAMLSAPSGLAPEQRELATIVDEEADRMSQLVSEAIQMARIEAGKIQLHKELCTVRDLLDSVLREMAPQLEGRKVHVQIADGLPGVFADGELIHLVLRQMVDNAVRYTSPGSPLSLLAGQRGPQIAISVADRGPGIPEGEREKIFERFYRSPHTPRHVTGSGMGLAIGKEIVEAHGGRISVEPGLGGGSVFTISLPLEKPEGQT
jgi:two-component system, OmpR family, sensor histidine kinase KdpD